MLVILLHAPFSSASNNENLVRTDLRIHNDAVTLVTNSSVALVLMEKQLIQLAAVAL
jgi:hypothetical protein